MRDLIYYPGFEVTDKNWLKFALLYFDCLRPIVPRRISWDETRFSKDYLAIVRETNLIEPYIPGDEEGANASAKAIDLVSGFMEYPQRLNGRRGFRFGQDVISEVWRSKEQQNYTLYSEKFTGDFFEFCVREKLAQKSGEGLLISQDLAFMYMSLLANTISKNQKNADMITDDYNCFSLLIGSDLQEFRNSQARVKAQKEKVEFFCPFDLDQISFDQIIKLRNDDQYGITRKHFVNKVEYHLDHPEVSMEDLTSIREEMKHLLKAVSLTILDVCVTAESIYSAVTGGEFLPMELVAGVAMTIQAASSAIPTTCSLADDMHSKLLARKYLTNLSNLKRMYK